MFKCKSFKTNTIIYSGVLGISLLFFILPFCVNDLKTIIWFGLFHFIAAFLFFIAYPGIVVFFQTRPIYVEDMQKLDTKVTKVYIFILIFFTSILWGMFTDYVLIKDVFEKPLFEIIAIIGGNIAFFGKIQNMGGNGLLICFFQLKKKQNNRTPVIQPTTPKLIPPKIESMLHIPKENTDSPPKIEIGKAISVNEFL